MKWCGLCRRRAKDASLSGPSAAKPSRGSHLEDITEKAGNLHAYAIGGAKASKTGAVHFPSVAEGSQEYDRTPRASIDTRVQFVQGSSQPMRQSTTQQTSSQPPPPPPLPQQQVATVTVSNEPPPPPQQQQHGMLLNGTQQQLRQQQVESNEAQLAAVEIPIPAPLNEPSASVAAITAPIGTETLDAAIVKGSVSAQAKVVVAEGESGNEGPVPMLGHITASFKASSAEDGFKVEIERIEANIPGVDTPKPLDALEALEDLPEDDSEEERQKFLSETAPELKCPRMNVVIMIVGTRGDVQPFVALGLKLREMYGHRVRLASHAMYREFVTGNGLEFYPLGGDPQVLSEYMVKNGGFMPSSRDDLSRNRRMIREIVYSTWDACVKPDPSSLTSLPFLADAIISNPPTYGHIHCAERLCVPLHMYFTMPWSPTKRYPHPLARMGYSRVNDYRNKISYSAIDSVVWAGVMDIVNDFRVDVLKLEPIRVGAGGSSFLHNSRVPFCYTWSPSLAPKPADWGPHIDVVGFFFLDSLAKNYQPPADLAAFFKAGPPPIYIGFGSLVVKDPVGLTKKIYAAIARTGVRALVSKGWGGLGGDAPPNNVFMLGNVPHDWLFPQCSAVIHHGGAGTTAAGARAGRPSTVVWFFGDQPFWGQMIHDQGAGPPPIHIDALDEDNLVNAILYMQRPQVAEAARSLQARMAQEDGLKAGAEAFRNHLPLKTMICDLCSERLARVWVHEEDLKLCFTCDHIVNESDFASTHPTYTRSHFRYIAWSVNADDPTANSAATVSQALTSAGGGLIHETAAGVTGVVTEPLRGYEKGGVQGLAIGAGRGIAGLVHRPIRGGVVLLDRVGAGISNLAGNNSGGSGDLSSIPETARSTSASSILSTLNETGTIRHVGDGLVQGSQALGGEVVGGLKGIYKAPKQGYEQHGATGAIMGTGKGLAGVVLRPLGGLASFLAKVGEGVLNTPGHVLEQIHHYQDEVLQTDMANAARIAELTASTSEESSSVDAASADFNKALGPEAVLAKRAEDPAVRDVAINNFNRLRAEREAAAEALRQHRADTRMSIAKFTSYMPKGPTISLFNSSSSNAVSRLSQSTNGNNGKFGTTESEVLADSHQSLSSTRLNQMATTVDDVNVDACR